MHSHSIPISSKPDGGAEQPTDGTTAVLRPLITGGIETVIGADAVTHSMDDGFVDNELNWPQTLTVDHVTPAREHATLCARLAAEPVVTTALPVAPVRALIASYAIAAPDVFVGSLREGLRAFNPLTGDVWELVSGGLSLPVRSAVVDPSDGSVVYAKRGAVMRLVWDRMANETRGSWIAGPDSDTPFRSRTDRFADVTFAEAVFSRGAQTLWCSADGSEIAVADGARVRLCDLRTKRVSTLCGFEDFATVDGPTQPAAAAALGVAQAALENVCCGLADPFHRPTKPFAALSSTATAAAGARHDSAASGPPDLLILTPYAIRRLNRRTSYLSTLALSAQPPVPMWPVWVAVTAAPNGWLLAVAAAYHRIYAIDPRSGEAVCLTAPFGDATPDGDDGDGRWSENTAYRGLAVAFPDSPAPRVLASDNAKSAIHSIPLPSFLAASATHSA